MALLTLLCHAGLLPEARWTGDEYELLATRADPSAYYLGRILGWSPRPMSEALVGLYAALVAGFGRPLIMVPLALCWLALLVAPLLAWRSASGRFRGGAAISLVLPALLLLAAKPGEVFYWPAASLAYLPALTGMVFVSVFAVAIGGWDELGGRSRPQRLAVLGALLVAACSSEMGACFALFLAVFSSPQTQLRRTGWVWLPPAALSLFILLAFNTYRGQGSDVMLPSSPTFRAFGVSVWSAALSYCTEFVYGLPPGHGGMRVVVGGVWGAIGGLALRGLLFLGLGPVIRPVAAQRLNVVNLAPAAALLASGFVSLFSAYYKFGTVCCERHETMRQSLFMLATLCAAAAVPWPTLRELRGAALLLAMVVLAAARLPNIHHDYTVMHEVIASKAANWESGHGRGSAMLFTPGPSTVVAGGGWFPPAGSYRLNASGIVDAPDGGEITRLLNFFGKTDVQVRY